MSETRKRIQEINPAEVSAVEFHKRFIATRTPCILTSHPTDWPNDFNWNTVVENASDTIIQVENKTIHGFGSGNPRLKMTVKEFNTKLSKGSYYLTTQYSSNESESQDDSQLITEYCQPPLTPLIGLFPSRPTILGNLIPQQVNLWVGYQKDLPTSSGLHHDFCDNLYILLAGHKKFTLFSPSDAKYMYTFGKIIKVWKNGFIQYEDNMREDGAYLGDVATWKLKNAQLLLEKCEKEGLDTLKAEEMVDNALEECLLYQNESEYPGSSDDEDDDEIKLGSKRKNLQNTDIHNVKRPDVNQEPNSFSKIDIGTLHSKDIPSKYSLLKKAIRYEVEIKSGQALYLPAGWFHEVSSSGCGTSNDKKHVAFNYWMHPPTNEKFEAPYDDKYWESSWNNIKNIIDTKK